MSPIKLEAKKPFHNAHKIHLELIRKEVLKPLLHPIISGEVDEIINIQAKIDGCTSRRGGG
jgi:hypothetical protein